MAVRFFFTCGNCGVKTEHQGELRECPICGHSIKGFDFEKEGTASAAGSTERGWPILSDSMGVHPKQIKRAEQVAQEHGVPIKFTPDGRAIFENRAQRKRYCRAFGYRDNDGGYGDP